MTQLYLPRPTLGRTGLIIRKYWLWGISASISSD